MASKHSFMYQVRWLGLVTKVKVVMTALWSDYAHGTMSES